MEKIDMIWMLGGATLIAAVSSLILIPGVMNPAVPTPIYLVVLAWVISYGFIIVLPLIYIIQFRLFYKSTSFGKFTLITAIIISMLNICYFWVSWEYGVNWQGETHTKIVAAENLIGFTALIVLAYLGLMRHSKLLQYSANLLLFLLLSWCAFPYLGELP